MAWLSMDHCHVPLLALAWSTIITGSTIKAHKFMDICGSNVTGTIVIEAPFSELRCPRARAQKPIEGGSLC